MASKIIQLQGIRCIAIVAVLLYHVWPHVFVNGFMGVDVKKINKNFTKRRTKNVGSTILSDLKSDPEIRRVGYVGSIRLKKLDCLSQIRMNFPTVSTEIGFRFFVLSGYIMARILLSSDSLKTDFLSTTLNFYYRRIYRILPLYLLNIFITILIVPTISYSATAVDGLFSQVFTVLSFSKNFDNVAKYRSYFNHALSIDMFTHYWSLCVEMQFYLVVPFLLLFAKRFPYWFNLCILWPTLIIACVGLIIYKVSNFGVYGLTYIFYMLPAKIYEFFAGFISYYIQEWTIQCFSDGKIKLKIRHYCHHVATLNILSLILMAIVFWPIKFDDSIAIQFHIGFTIGTVITTSAIIALIGRTEKSKEKLQFSILAQNLFVYIGNASYSLYIFHWLFIVFSKSMLEETQNNQLIILILCFLTGCLAHKYIEKPICNAKLPWKISLSWIALSYATICLLAYSNDYDRIPSLYSKEIYYNKSKLIGNSLEWKEIASTISPDIAAEIGIYSGEIECQHHERSEYATSIKETLTDGAEFKGNGNLSVLVIGNSHAVCEAPGIKLAMEGLYSQLNTIVIGGVTPFDGFKTSGVAFYIFQNAVKHYKPDVIFLIFKYQTDFEDPSTDTDYHMMKVQEMITFLSNHSKVVFISGIQAQFNTPKFYSIKFTEMIYNHGWVNDYRINQKMIEKHHTVSQKRMNGIKCENCIFYDRLEAFCKGGWCSPLDETRKVPLVFDSDHVTIFGSHLLSKYIKKYFNQMFYLLLK